MDSRRRFLETMAGAAGAMTAPASVLGANDRIRLGMIGPGDQGSMLLRAGLKCPDAEFVAFADVYTARLEAAKKLVPAAKTSMDYRYLLDDKSIDAVIIATPQHLHAEHFCAALEAGKHVYQEKTMAFTVAHAKKMRAAYQKAKNRIVQIGHQGCSGGSVADEANWVKAGLLGKITEVHGHMYRNTPHGQPQWTRPIAPSMTPENIIWKSFLGEAPQRPFDANRYINWRFFWDYSGGNYYENMCHQVAIGLQDAGPANSEGGDLDGGRLLVEGRARSAGHHVRVDGTPRGTARITGPPASETPAWAAAPVSSAPTVRLRDAATCPRKSTGRTACRSLERPGHPGTRGRFTYRTSWTVFARGRNPTARSNSGSAFRSPAAWPWTAIARSASSGGTRSKRKSSNGDFK